MSQYDATQRASIDLMNEIKIFLTTDMCGDVQLSLKLCTKLLHNIACEFGLNDDLQTIFHDNYVLHVTRDPSVSSNFFQKNIESSTMTDVNGQNLYRFVKHLYNKLILSAQRISGVEGDELVRCLECLYKQIFEQEKSFEHHMLPISFNDVIRQVVNIFKQITPQLSVHDAWRYRDIDTKNFDTFAHRYVVNLAIPSASSVLAGTIANINSMNGAQILQDILIAQDVHRSHYTDDAVECVERMSPITFDYYTKFYQQPK